MVAVWTLEKMTEEPGLLIVSGSAHGPRHVTTQRRAVEQYTGARSDQVTEITGCYHVTRLWNNATTLRWRLGRGDCHDPSHHLPCD